MRPPERKRSAHGAVHESELDHDRRGPGAPLAGIAEHRGDGELRRHRARRRRRPGAHGGGPGPEQDRARRGRPAVRAARRLRRAQPARRAADHADRAGVGRDRAGLRPRADDLQRFARARAPYVGCNRLSTALCFASMAVRRSAAPTLADVAAEAGVSQATASRALAESPLVNADTRRRVWEVAERLHFQPNRLARSPRSGATMAVGLVVPDVGAAFYASALKSAQDVLEAAGYHVLVLNTGRAAERERQALRTLRAHQVDGLLVATSGGYEEIGVPAVFFDNVPPQPGAGAVAMDND